MLCVKDRLLDGVLGVLDLGRGLLDEVTPSTGAYRVAVSVLDWSEMGMFAGRPGGRHSPLGGGWG